VLGPGEIGCAHIRGRLVEILRERLFALDPLQVVQASRRFADSSRARSNGLISARSGSIWSIWISLARARERVPARQARGIGIPSCRAASA
jgi:hypothetical protein